MRNRREPACSPSQETPGMERDEHGAAPGSSALWQRRLSWAGGLPCPPCMPATRLRVTTIPGPVAHPSPLRMASAALIAATLTLRTALEDRTLQEELPGYREYAQQTRYRLVPGVW